MPGSGTRGATHPPSQGLAPTLSVLFCPPPLPSAPFNTAFSYQWPLALFGAGTLDMWGARWGPEQGVCHVQTISEAAFSSLPWSSGCSAFTLGLTQRSKEAHLPGLEGVAAASMIPLASSWWLWSTSTRQAFSWCQDARSKGHLQATSMFFTPLFQKSVSGVVFLKVSDQQVLKAF